MIKFSDILLDYSKYPEILQLVSDNYNFNNGCVLHKHWKEFSQKDYDAISRGSGQFKSLSWMGNGYPNTTEYRQPYEDKYNLMVLFSDHQTVDVQSGLYQFYTIEKLFHEQLGGFPPKNDGINIMEVGGGYGRLAMFFLAYYGENCHYVNIDFVPTSLEFSPQVMKQMFPGLEIGNYESSGDLQKYNYISLPTWRIDELVAQNYDLGLNIHSFQEMERKSIDFYKHCFYKNLKADGILYVINNPPELGSWYTSHDYYCLENLFKCFYYNKYPIGDDWEKICGVPTLERAFFMDDPSIIDTVCKHCGFWYGITDGDVESICHKCNMINEHND